MADGAVIAVHRREHLVVTSTHIMLGLDPDESGIPTLSRYLDARSVTQIEPLPNEEKAA
jgi:cation transporter-like permease